MMLVVVDVFVCYYEVFGYGYVVSFIFNVVWDLLMVLENWVEK